MTRLEQTHNTLIPSTKRRRIQSVRYGKFKVMYRPGTAFEETRLRLVKQGLLVHETSHFLFAVEHEDQFTILVHRLKTNEIDNNIGHYLMQELAPVRLILTDKDFGSALIAIVISVIPDNPVEVWNLFSLNTLQRLREKLNYLTSPTGEKRFYYPFCAYLSPPARTQSR